MQRSARKFDQRNTRHSARCRLAFRRRPGFTLIELLIVVSIIAVLLLLTIRVMGAFIGQARDAATQATLRKVNGLLHERANAVYRLEQRSGYLATTPQYNQAAGILLNLPTANPYRSSVALQKILTLKLLAVKFFPQLPVEVTDATLYPNIVNVPLSNPELLYQFLTQSNIVGSTPIGTDAFSTSEVKDIDKNGYPEFVDAWGNPLYFYRWPTRLFRASGSAEPTPANPRGTIDATNAKVLFSTLPSFSGDLTIDLARDPEDPLRLCLNAFTSFEGSGFHTAATYHVMLVVSAGPDGILGLYPPNDTANKGHLAAVRDPEALYDDITYLNIRAGGR